MDDKVAVFTADFAYNPSEARKSKGGEGGGEWTASGMAIGEAKRQDTESAQDAPGGSKTKQAVPGHQAEGKRGTEGSTGAPAGSEDAAEPYISVNLGITPSRGQPAADVKGIEGYYGSTRYRGWLSDVQTEAKGNGVSVEDIVKVAGVWQGSVEPSASLWVKGNAKSIRAFAANLGAEYNQDGVLMFTAEDDGAGSYYTLPGLAEADRDKVIKAMGTAKIDGGRIVQMRDGGFALEIAGEGADLYDNVKGLAESLGTELYATPGTVTFLSAGSDYQKHSRPAKGKGKTHATVSAGKAKFSSLFDWAWFDSKGTGKTPDKAKAADGGKDWGRDAAWAKDGVTVNPLPKKMALVMMRGGYMTDAPTKGEPVEVYTDDGMWTPGFVAISDVTQGEMGGPNEYKSVVWVGHNPDEHKGQEIPAELVRCLHDKQTRRALSGDNGEHDKSAGRLVDKTPTGKAKFTVMLDDPDAADPRVAKVLADLHRPRPPMTWHPNDTISYPDKGVAKIETQAVFFDPLQRRGFHGKWIDEGKGKPPTYQREHADVSGKEGLEIGVNPRFDMTDKTKASAQVAFDQVYGITHEAMMGNIAAMAGRWDKQQAMEWRKWYYDAADLMEEMAEDTGTTMTQAAIATAATSPQTFWGTPQFADKPKGDISNQRLAYKALQLIGQHSDDVYDVTPELAAKIKKSLSFDKHSVDLTNYNGEYTEFAGKNLLGPHKVKDLPPDVLAKVTHSQFRGIDGNVATALQGIRTSDPETLGGPKTRSFYNDMRFPETATDNTIDIFMVRMLTGHADLMAEEISDLTNNSAKYEMLASAVDESARKMGLKAHELQAMLWVEAHKEASAASGLTDWEHATEAQQDAASTDYYKKSIQARQERINEARKQQGLEPIIFDEGEIKRRKAAGEHPNKEVSYWKGKFYSDSTSSQSN